MKTTRHFDKRHPRRAFIMVGQPDGTAVHRYTHPNFWKWSKRARRCFIRKRWPGAEWVGDGTPFTQPGGQYMTMPKPLHPWQQTIVKALTTGRVGTKAKKAIFLAGLSPKPKLAASQVLQAMQAAGTISKRTAAAAMQFLYPSA